MLPTIETELAKGQSNGWRDIQRALIDDSIDADGLISLVVAVPEKD